MKVKVQEQIETLIHCVLYHNLFPATMFKPLQLLSNGSLNYCCDISTSSLFAIGTVLSHAGYH